MAMTALALTSNATAGNVLWDPPIVANGFNGRAVSPPGFPDIRVADDFTIGGDTSVSGAHFGMIEDAGPRVLSRESLLARFGRPRERTVVFTNGCFDLLHRGHLEYLDEAKALVHALFVGLNSDASVRRLKGSERPFVPEGDRAAKLAALRSVDAVTLFDEDTPLALISALLPDVLVKGGDYDLEGIVGCHN